MSKNKRSKKIVVAKSAGFCWGVNRAFDKVLQVAKEADGDLYTYGPLIHNPEAVERLEEEGVKVLETVPEKLNGVIFVRTHGISPEERAKIKASGATIYDATCPDVGKIQGIVKKYLKRGYHIVIVGNSEHPEVKALLGFAEGMGVVVSSVADIEQIPREWNDLCVVAQSTQKEEDYLSITEILRKRHKNCLVYNTICKSTAHRQEEVRRLSDQVDAMVVVGGYNSANTNKLAQISRETETPTFHIERATELKINDFNDFEVIGVTAGASTPRWSIEEVIEELRQIGEVEVSDIYEDSRPDEK